ncbi:MAG: dihydrodipicolinate reductase C-terminal domain-containing protein [Vicinamibacterales bacterium]
MSAPLRVLIVGYGRMGRLVAALAPEYGFDVAGTVTRSNAGEPETWPSADVAIDFSTAKATPAHARALAARGVSVVIGTTGWQAEESALRTELAAAGAGVISAPNFAVGVNIFIAIAERSAQLLAARGFASWIHEAHHAAKKDAPSGTALALQRVLEHAGASPSVSSTRAGYIPGTHTVGFDSPAETLAFTHTARDRTPFARGALEAAKWIHGRRGWYGMRDLLSL